MPRFFLRLSFKGTQYAGWQIQENAITVQEKLNYALSVLNGAPIQTTGCGRTDTGVHAKQFYAHFDSEPVADSVKFLYQLNSILPSDIAVQELIPVEAHRHARYDAVERCYEYFISVKKDPFLEPFTYFAHPVPDIDLMSQACTYLITKDDFSSFSKTNTQVKTNICHIRNAVWEYKNQMLVFTIYADRYLRGMVRAIVGTLLEVGYSKIDPSFISEIISGRDRSRAGAAVPACGLYLSSIQYPYLQTIPINTFPA